MSFSVDSAKFVDGLVKKGLLMLLDYSLTSKHLTTNMEMSSVLLNPLSGEALQKLYGLRLERCSEGLISGVR